MNGICLVAGLLLAQFGDEITLRWTHSIQKIVWEEDYRREGNALRLVEARVRGSGAGMEPPPEAVLRDGAWHYVPSIKPLSGVALRNTRYAAPYIICVDGLCQAVDVWLPGLPDDSVLNLRPCA